MSSKPKLTCDFFVRCLKWLAKLAYVLIPLKAYLFVAIRRVFSPTEEWYQHLHFCGQIRVRLDEPHLSVLLEHRGSISENQLFWSGLDGWYERTSLSLWLKLARRATVIADIGANSGIYALTASVVNPEARVYAFEPVPTTFEWLQRNIKLNKSCVIAEPVALSNQNGYGTIWLQSSTAHYTPSLHQANMRAKSGGVTLEVKKIRFGDYLRSKGSLFIDLIKIDVENHEPEVLEGMHKLLVSCRPTLIVEVLGNEAGSRIESMLYGLGYQYFNICETRDIIERKHHITVSHDFNYLVIHSSKLASVKEHLKNGSM